ncbi:MAG: hypothetical protein LBK71_11680 [Verrucomicrobiales bacterium]|jgi:hypothetical protein|nr:hypothetical protein [Verrucomicrobiales bacterium]
MNPDRQILRELAHIYAEYSRHPRNAENAALYRAVNDLRQIRPVVLLDEIPFHELNVDGSLTLRCADPFLRGVEDYLRKTIFKWRHFPADMIVPPHLRVGKVINSTGIGITVEEETINLDAANHISSHGYVDQFARDEDLQKLREPVISYDHAETMRRYQLVADQVGDIIPVKIGGVQYIYSMIWDEISSYRGVSSLLIDLIDREEFMHALVKRLYDIRISVTEQYEKLGLYEYGPETIHCVSALTDDLPAPDPAAGAQRKNIWCRGAAQILGSVSKEMQEEFEFQYTQKLFAPFGLVYYGCCEPLHQKLDALVKMPHLRKIGVTPWADLDVMAEFMGDKYVMAVKPNPASVAVGSLDEDGLRKELGRILDAARRNHANCDIVLKDISSASYRLENLVRWEQIAMELVRAW